MLTYEASKNFQRETGLINESHYIVNILQCPACLQKFLFIFTETVDYVENEDPQHRIFMPLTNEEIEKLKNMGGSISEQQLETFGKTRHSLHWDYPRSGKKRIYWRTGIVIPYHD